MGIFLIDELIIRRPRRLPHGSLFYLEIVFIVLTWLWFMALAVVAFEYTVRDTIGLYFDYCWARSVWYCKGLVGKGEFIRDSGLCMC